jgi:hypothetical protein
MADHIISRRNNTFIGDRLIINSFTTSSTANLWVSGSTILSGSLTVVTGSGVEFEVTNTGVKLGNLLTDVHQVTGSLNISGSITGSLRGTATSASYAVFAEGVVSPFLLMGA